MRTYRLIILCLFLPLFLLACRNVETSVSVSYEGLGKITESNQLDCGERCEADYVVRPIGIESSRGYGINILATAAPGYEFFAWDTSKLSFSGDPECGPDPVCLLVLYVDCNASLPTLPFLPGVCTQYEGHNEQLHAIFVPANSVVLSARNAANETCLIDTGGVLRCWGKNVENVPDTSFQNPQDLQVGGDMACLLHGKKLSCWGAALSEFSMPALTSTTHFALDPGNTFGCAIDLGKVRCFGIGRPEMMTPPALKNPTELWASDRIMCARDDNGTQCWGIGIEGQANPPALTNVQNITSSEYGACAIADGGLHCWGDMAKFNALNAQLINPFFVELAPSSLLCVGDDTGMRCWDREPTRLFGMPDSLKDSTELKVSDSQICGRDSNGLECWRISFNNVDGYHVLATAPIPLNASLQQASSFDLAASGACGLNGRTLSCSGLHNLPINDRRIVPHTVSLLQPTAVGVNYDALCIGGADGFQCPFVADYSSLARDIPQKLLGVTAIDLSDWNGCVIHQGKVTCWGYSGYGMLNPPPLQNPVAVSLGKLHACALDDTGVVCWGAEVPKP